MEQNGIYLYVPLRLREREREKGVSQCLMNQHLQSHIVKHKLNFLDCVHTKLGEFEFMQKRYLSFHTKFPHQNAETHRRVCCWWCLEQKTLSVPRQPYVIISETLRFPCPHCNANPAFFQTGFLCRVYQVSVDRTLVSCNWPVDLSLNRRNINVFTKRLKRRCLQ